jgi:predicted nucleotidyltransferase
VRITREKLIELARTEAERRAEREDVISAYLIGSVASGEPLLGGSADVDLILIHVGDPPIEREMVALSADAHLDIGHHARALYAQPRQLRIHPWLGPAISNPVFVFDPQHFFEWAQAGTRGQFHRPDHARQRARNFLSSARRVQAELAEDPGWLPKYLRAVQQAANAAACLSGPPASGRRTALELERRAQALDRPEVFNGYLRLIGVDNSGGWSLPDWLTAWARAFDDAAGVSSDPRLHPCRQAYHRTGFQALAEAGRPDAVVWPLLVVWERAMTALESHGRSEPHHSAWSAARQQLDLTDASLKARAEDLDVYLDHIEVVIEDWAEKAGA